MGKPNASEHPSYPQDSYPELKGVRVTWDKKTHQLRKARGLLTEESDEASERVASRFLDRYSPLLGKDEGSVLDDLKLTQVTRSPAGYEARFQQYVGEVPVYRGQVSIYLTERGQVYGISNSYRPNAARVDVTEALKGGIEAPKACQIAVDEVRGEGRLRRAPEAELVIYPLNEENRLAWQVSVALKAPVQVWVVFVDVCTGRVLDKVPTLMRRAE
ncbi:MAG: hypothetical protein ACE5OS_13680 [Anaerolineae bacterium]